MARVGLVASNVALLTQEVFYVGIQDRAQRTQAL